MLKDEIEQISNIQLQAFDIYDFFVFFFDKHKNIDFETDIMYNGENAITITYQELRKIIVKNM